MVGADCESTTSGNFRVFEDYGSNMKTRNKHGKVAEQFSLAGKRQPLKLVLRVIVQVGVFLARTDTGSD
jgi:hypothetical protein